MRIVAAKRLDRIGEYIFSYLAKKIKEVEKKSQKKVLNFGVGNPDIKPSPIYLDKLHEFIKEDNAHLYPGFGANDQFSAAIISWYKKRFGVKLNKDELFPLLGAKEGVSHLPLALLDEGDEVLVPDPGYPAFGDPALMIGAKVIYYNLTEENNFKISLKELEKNVSDKTKFIWVNFPSNPTGQIATVEELQGIVDFAKKYQVLIVFDNAYSEITFDGFIAPSILQIEGSKEVAIEIGSFSKTFSFAGFRMGWMVGNKEVISAFAKLKSQIDSGMSTPLQNLGAFALTNFDQNWHQKMIQIYQQRRQIICTKLKKLGLQFKEPKGGLYIWAKIPESAKDAVSFCMQILEKRQILLTPGSAFGKNGERFVRVSISVNIDEIDKYF